ncbi:hypothetical protein GGQ68_002751 [Sagittula marina]|uniref:Ig-like domain (Group 3) n=1 Tax=Sagittula marina TaxID=943940 RepID=A0A7W6DT25_9RHOB|nr:Ig-like domain-containing protein [Sagittula marina]MBB3986412.1 hypothetical protein [Sagittula marina]
MNAIDFVIRTGAGTVERGSVGGEGQEFLLDAGYGNDISLNLSQMDLSGYDRADNDLLITLADGRVIVLENYFSEGALGAANSRLFLSANGELNEVSFVEAEGGALFAQYGPTETWGKWSPSDELIFINDPEVMPQVAGEYEEEEVGMAAALPLLGLGGGAMASGAGALLGLPLLVGGKGDGGGSGGGDWTAPTVDNADATHGVSGNDDAVLVITGTAEPGSTVEIVIGDSTAVGTSGDDGTWEVVFEEGSFPGDGTYDDVPVTVTDPNGTVTDLDGPSYNIDTTPPAIEIAEGTVSLGDVENAAEFQDGVTVGGTGEAGAELTITVGDYTETQTIAEDGTWSFTFDETVFAEGEYTTDITLTATDAMGNTTVVTDAVRVDTVNTVSLDNAPLTGDNLISAEELDAGVTLTGTTQSGAEVVVTIEGVSQSLVAGTDGAWSVTFSSTDLADGTYDTTAEITSTDDAGNVTTITHGFSVDTDLGLTIDTDTFAGDGVVNAAEFASDVTLTGTGEAGATVVVASGANALGTATVAADGTWSIVFDPTLLDGGPGDADLGYTGTITATATDAASNVTTTSGQVTVDTNTSVIGMFDDGDQIINAAERADGVSLSGAAEPGAAISVVVAGETLTTTALADGTWSVNIAAALIPTGETTLTAEVTATDLAGNSASASINVAVDTTVFVDMDASAVEGDGTVNASERADGVQLSGTTEAGASVVVTVGGTAYEATVTDGTWSVTVPANAVPQGETSMTVGVAATDVAGNTATESYAVDIDTTTAVSLNTGIVAGDGTVNAAEYASSVTLTGAGEAGSTIVVTSGFNTLGTTTVAANGTWSIAFSPSLIDGGPGHSELGYSGTITATATDLAGNTSSSSGTVAVDTNTTVLGFFEDSDQIINAAERADGVTLSGTSEAGAAISVVVAGVSMSTTALADGSWSVDVPAAIVPTGETTMTAAVSATDPAGNTSAANISIAIDTITNVGMDPSTVEGDGTVNAAERADGLQLTGTTEAGASVVVAVGGAEYNAVVTGQTWSITIPAANVPQGETSLSVGVTATDKAGNTDSNVYAVDIDTTTFVTVPTDTVEGEGVVNAAERSDGVVLNGTAEPGASVTVTMAGVTHDATVMANGSWTVKFAASEIPTGEQTVTVTANAIDPAGNAETASSTIDVDTLVRNFGITSTPGGADGVVNAAEASSGLELTGTTEPGGAVQLTLNGHTVTASVAADGSWTARFSASQLPSGEVTTTLTAVTTDLAGNTDTLTQNVVIDTDAGRLTISPDPVEGDDVVNMVEASDGVVLTGTSDPGQWVDVTMNGVSHTVLTDATGTWVAPFSGSEIAPGTYDAAITATITDSAGNTLTRTDSVHVDTEVLNFAASGDPVETDNVINADEASDGFSLSGTTEAGATVTVTFEGVTQTATVAANGSWTVNFAASDIPSGEMNTSATVDTTDIAGNTATTTVNFAIDTYVNALSMDSNATGDGVVNAAEAQAGITLTGDVEPGSTVSVTLGGVVHTAVVAASGAWSVDIPSSSIPTGTLDTPVTIAATDAAGNTDSISQTLSIDTEASETLSWTGYGRSGGGVAQVWTEATDDAMFLGQVDNPSGSASVSEVNIANTVESGNDAYLFLDAPVADGTHLVLASTDAAGNTSGAYLVTDDPSTNQVQMSDDIASALRVYNVDTIDLHFAEDSNLTLTESQIAELSATSDTVAIRGGADDSITIDGAVAGGTHSEGGVNYNVFTLGDTTVLIEDDITNITTVV